MDIDRRRFMALVGCAVAGPTGTAHAQDSRRVRTVGFLLGLANDEEAKGRIAAFEEGLKKEGWRQGHDLKMVYRYGAGDASRFKAFAKELVDLKCDVIVGHSTPVTREILQATRRIPVVFVVVADPVGSGFATSIPHPGGNATGFTNLDSGITGKMLTILKQMLPELEGAALMFNPETVAKAGQFYSRSFEEAAPAFAVKPITADVRSPADIEKTMASLSGMKAVGLIVMPDNFTTVNRDMIISLAERYKIPAIYPYRYFAEGGGLLSYGVDVTDLFRRAPEYVSRILRGANPADLPIQAPSKFELVINLKAAKALKLSVPKILLAGADALIE